MYSFYLITLHQDYILGVVDIISGDALEPFYAPQIIINYIKPPKHFLLKFTYEWSIYSSWCPLFRIPYQFVFIKKISLYSITVNTHHTHREGVIASQSSNSVQHLFMVIFIINIIF